jgi:hypothetical protein
MSTPMSYSSDTSPWKALRLRATTFLSPDSEIDDTSIWSSVVGGLPDEEQRRPRESLLQQTGKLANFEIALRIVHPRIDWFVQPAIENPAGVDPPPDWQVALFDEALTTLKQLASQWFSMQLHVVRVAFGANLVQPANDMREAYSTLDRYLADLKVDPENSSDLLYQINRPRGSRVIEGLEINRLSKWSVMAQASGGWVLQTNPAVGEQVASLPVALRHASSLELDVNTKGTHGTNFPQPRLNELFDELMEWGSEIAEKGDVP